jgi:hypothetical protein
MRLDQAFTWGARRHECWLATLDDHRVQYLVVDAFRDHELLRAARLHPRWTIDFRDGASVLLVQKQSPGGTEDGVSLSAPDSQGFEQKPGLHNS